MSALVGPFNTIISSLASLSRRRRSSKPEGDIYDLLMGPLSHHFKTVRNRLTGKRQILSYTLSHPLERAWLDNNTTTCTILDPQGNLERREGCDRYDPGSASQGTSHVSKQVLHIDRWQAPATRPNILDSPGRTRVLPAELTSLTYPTNPSSRQTILFLSSEPRRLSHPCSHSFHPSSPPSSLPLKIEY